MKKFAAFVICLFVLASCANAHLFRRARVQYIVVDPCGCVEMQVDETRGTVAAQKIEKKVEIRREIEVHPRQSIIVPKPKMQEFPPVIEEIPPVINDLPADEVKPEEQKAEEKQSILVLSGDYPVTK